MRVFKEFPKQATCPICNTNKKGECVLIAINGTQEGYNAQALPVQLDCLNLWITPEKGFIYQKIKTKEE